MSIVLRKGEKITSDELRVFNRENHFRKFGLTFHGTLSTVYVPTATDQ